MLTALGGLGHPARVALAYEEPCPCRLGLLPPLPYVGDPRGQPPGRRHSEPAQHVVRRAEEVVGDALVEAEQRGVDGHARRLPRRRARGGHQRPEDQQGQQDHRGKRIEQRDCRVDRHGGDKHPVGPATALTHPLPSSMPPPGGRPGPAAVVAIGHPAHASEHSRNVRLKTARARGHRRPGKGRGTSGGREWRAVGSPPVRPSPYRRALADDRRPAGPRLGGAGRGPGALVRVAPLRARSPSSRLPGRGGSRPGPRSRRHDPGVSRALGEPRGRSLCSWGPSLLPLLARLSAGRAGVRENQARGRNACGVPRPSGARVSRGRDRHARPRAGGQEAAAGRAPPRRAWKVRWERGDWAEGDRGARVPLTRTCRGSSTGRAALL